MKPIHFLTAALTFTIASAAEYASDWQGDRRWIGPEFWASPLFDWETKDGKVEVHAGPKRFLHLLSHHLSAPKDGFEASVEATLLVPGQDMKHPRNQLGFAVGVQAMMDDIRHIAVQPNKFVDAVIRGDGKLAIGGDAVSEQSLAGSGPVVLELSYKAPKLTLRGRRDGQSISVSKTIPAEQLVGNLCLTAGSVRKPNDKRGAVRVTFDDWKVSGKGVTETGLEPFGPILWSQYTRQGTTLKLSAQMPPMGPKDSKQVSLQLRGEDDKWFELGKADIDPLSCTALFRAELPSAETAWNYRLVYQWKDQDYEWSGKIAADPAIDNKPLKLGVFSCDNGYAFPIPTLTRNVAIHEPNLLFFAGDQIYENYSGLGLIRKPLKKAMLDYHRKFQQFGWTWRHLLKDIPSIMLPDDHDVFQGNIWGAGGRAIKNINEGGYLMDAEWVKAVERTQVGHLPDPVDPKPIEQGIGVYFTRMNWGGVPIAILEDRKWKSGPLEVLPKDRMSLPPEKTDVPGAILLGERQEAFLQSWGEQTKDEPLRLVLSQTIFCKGHTHTGPQLKKNRYDWDSNGWPRSGRQRALRPLIGNNTVMLHGDQHLGLMVRHGVEKHGDGPWAFMVPGTANGWPRAWWPEDGSITGDFTDVFGNAFSVLAAGNPERGSNEMNPRKSDPPELTAHKKGSGYGIVTIPPDRSSARFDLWRYRFDAAKPNPTDQFEGFPITLEFGDN